MTDVGVSGRSQSRRRPAGKSQGTAKLAPRQQRGASGSDFRIFGEGKRVFYVNPKIAHRILNLAMPEKDLDGA